MAAARDNRVCILSDSQYLTSAIAVRQRQRRLGRAEEATGGLVSVFLDGKRRSRLKSCERDPSNCSTHRQGIFYMALWTR